MATRIVELKDTKSKSRIRFGKIQRIGPWFKIGRHESFCVGRCDCGNHKVFMRGNLCAQNTSSCGCGQLSGIERQRMAICGNGNRNHPEYRLWLGIIRRCESFKCQSYGDYGGRGISICERWRRDFRLFVSDMGPRPSPKHSIDRIDVNGNYEPGNCRWATCEIQSNNRRDNRFLVIDGRKMSVAMWSRESGACGASAIRRRLKAGWNAKDAVFFPAIQGRRAGAPDEVFAQTTC